MKTVLHTVSARFILGFFILITLFVISAAVYAYLAPVGKEAEAIRLGFEMLKRASVSVPLTLAGGLTLDLLFKRAESMGEE